MHKQPLIIFESNAPKPLSFEEIEVTEFFIYGNILYRRIATCKLAVSHHMSNAMDMRTGALLRFTDEAPIKKVTLVEIKVTE